jgi:hypothetical protein
MIVGFWPTLLVSALGALLAEVLRVLPAMREKDRHLNAREIFVSLGYVMVGGAAVLMGWTDPQHAFSVAVLGAAFPSLFSNAVRAAANPSPRRTTRGTGRPGRRLVDYAAGRF